MLEKLADLSRRIGSLMLACLAALFGTINWRPPAWLSHCQNALAKLWHSAKAKPPDKFERFRARVRIGRYHLVWLSLVAKQAATGFNRFCRDRT
jgi:hypothetical protein